jgi:hypothetical protein
MRPGDAAVPFDCLFHQECSASVAAFPGLGHGASVVAGFVAGYHLSDVLRRVQAVPFVPVRLELEALVDLTVRASLPVVLVHCGEVG